MTITIGTIGRDQIPDMLPHLAPHLAKGLGAITFDPGILVADIEGNRTQVWAIVDDGELVGAFMTSILIEPSGERAVDVYGLGGERIMAWGRTLADRMAEFAKHENCRRVLFAGRKALARAYGETVREIGRMENGNFIFERAV